MYDRYHTFCRRNFSLWFMSNCLVYSWCTFIKSIFRGIWLCDSRGQVEPRFMVDKHEYFTWCALHILGLSQPGKLDCPTWSHGYISSQHVYLHCRASCELDNYEVNGCGKIVLFFLEIRLIFHSRDRQLPYPIHVIW